MAIMLLRLVLFLSSFLDASVAVPFSLCFCLSRFYPMLLFLYFPVSCLKKKCCILCLMAIHASDSNLCFGFLCLESSK